MNRAQEDRHIQKSLEILKQRFSERLQLSSPTDVREYLTLKLTPMQYEVFVIIYLDTRHNLISFEELFRGGIDGTEVHPREVVKEALRHNASALLVCHNHPSGVSEPSAADRAVTARLKQALALVEIRLLDHFIVAGGQYISMAERGLM